MVTEERNRVVFLLGAGASIPAGMPSTAYITEKILSGENVVKETDDTYYLGRDRWAEYGIEEEDVRRTTALLKLVQGHILEFNKGWNDSPVTYEDLAYYVSQLFDCLSGEYENPAVMPCANQLENECKDLLQQAEGKIGSTLRFIDLLDDAGKYIADVTWRLLCHKPTSLGHLSWIEEAHDDKDAPGIDLFTLNHDTSVEAFLDESGIPFVDGFGIKTNEVRYWALDLALSDISGFRLFKLHGSVDWFRLQSKRRDGDSFKIGRVLTPDIWHSRDQFNEFQWPVDGRPMILVGTFNKMLSYLTSVFTDLYCLFHYALRHSRRLIVVGYGFGDKGVNNRILNWMGASAANRLIIVHPSLERLGSRARPAVARKLEDWTKQGRLQLVPHYIQDIDWSTLRENLK